MAQDFELRQDGTAVIRSGGAEWILRRPTLGEFRKCFEVFQGADDALRAALDEIVEDDPVKLARARVMRANDLQMGDDEHPPIYGSVLVDFITMLGSGSEPPHVFKLPAWAVASDATAALLRHWRSVPVGPGVPGE